MDERYAAAYPDLYRRHWWWRAREAILLKRLAALLPVSRRPARLLDVGCGAGLFFDALEQFGHVEGIESDAIAIEHAGRWRDRIHVGELDGSFEPVAPFDAILMLDVLEHVPEPEQLLRSARRLLSASGFVLITVPAFNWLWTRHDDLNHHLRRYTAGQMRRIASGAGMSASELSYLFPSLVLPKVLVRLKERLISAPPAVPRLPGPFVNATLQTWLRIENAVAGWVPVGASLLVVARSPEPRPPRSS